MTIAALADVDALEECVGSRPPGFHLKSITYLDEHCTALLAASPFAVAGVVAGDGSIHTIGVGGDPGVLAVTGKASLELPGVGDLDVPDGAPIGLLAFVPGYRETLRINGRLRVAPVPTGSSIVEVDEAFLHCAKALIRSRLWDLPSPPPPIEPSAGPASLSDPEIASFLAASPLVALSSCDSSGAADVSPKGDPAGLVVQVIDERTLAIADRPGNRRTDTMHNLIDSDALGLLALVPGVDWVIEARGRGAITADEGIRSALAVDGKLPKAAITLTVDHLEVRRETGVVDARLWDTSLHVDPAALPKSTRIWVDHVKRNEDKGVAARAARKLVNVKMMDVGIEKDYRDNLY